MRVYKIDNCYNRQQVSYPNSNPYYASGAGAAGALGALGALGASVASVASVASAGDPGGAESSFGGTGED